MIVIDCSYALALVMPDEDRPQSLDRIISDRLIAPSVWPLEVANAMRNGVRRRRFADEDVVALFNGLGEFEVEVMAAPGLGPERYFELSRTHGLTPYDASYLELALLRRCALATLDVDMAAAAARVGLTVHA